MTVVDSERRWRYAPFELGLDKPRGVVARGAWPKRGRLHRAAAVCLL
jgi:hypothetical protein